MPNLQPDDPERPECPDWLSAGAKKIFSSIVEDLVKARVPVKAVDAHAISMAACCLDEVQSWSRSLSRLAKGDIEARKTCSSVIARNQRDLQQWLMVIGATPKGRAQMGLRGKSESKKLGAVASILQAKRQLSAGG